MRQRFSHPLVVAALVGIVVLLPVVALATLPRWTLDPIAIGGPGEDVQPASWSPDGTRFIFSRVDQFDVVRVSDGTVTRVGHGAFPVWVDDETIDSVRDIGQFRSQVARLTLSTGRVDTITAPLEASVRLVGRGVLDLAATTNVGTIETTILDPLDGRLIAHLPGILAIGWMRHGTLIGKTAGVDHPAYGVPPGSLVVWTLADDARPIGSNVIDSGELVAFAPAGDAIVCVCTDSGPGTTPPRDGIFRVPIDGSLARRVADVATGSFNTDPLPSLFDDGSLVYLDGAGLHRIGPDGTKTTITVDPGDLPWKGYYGRTYRLGTAIVLASQFGSTDAGQGRLTVMAPTGEVGYRQTLPSWNGVGMILDPARPKALVYTDPQRPDRPPQRFFVLRHQ
jgi:hypothetical protein